MSRICAVILDFDGVLAESNEEKDATFEELFALYPEYVAAMRAYHQANHALPRRCKFAHYVEHIMHRPGDQAAIEQMAQQYSTRVVDRVINCAEVPGTSAFLREFSGCLPLYISSVTPNEELQQIVEARGIGPHIKEAFGDPPHTKDQVVRAILDREGLQPDQVAFVGDSESDYQVARGAGLVFFARDSGRPFSDADLISHSDLRAVADALRVLI